MEPWGKAVALVAADVGEPVGLLFHLLRAAAFGHEEDSLAGDGELALESFDFFEIALGRDYEFEIRFL